MASLFQRNTEGSASPYWWINYRDPLTKKIVRESTRFSVGIGSHTRKAQEFCAQKSLEEKQQPRNRNGRWSDWVTRHVEEQVSGRTAERYLSAWHTLRMFLAEQKIDYPCDVNYQNCAGYLRWRETPDPAKGKYKARKNTAILEFKFFRWLMSEAVRRGYCTGNPAREVVLKREPRRLFPDLSDKTLQEIYAAILTVEDPNIRNCHLYSFAISLLQGVRLNETNINPVADVKLLGEIPTIRFWQKGSKGFKRERFKPLHPQLIPLFQRLQAANQTTTYSLKQGDHRWKWGNRWTKFFIRHNFKDQDPNICFHSIRITVENVLRESSIEQRVREYYLTHEHGHGDVNAAYDRVKIREMVACHACLTRPWLEL